MTWHLITGEFPPTPGGVSDYSLQIARALADAGDTVHVWSPRTGEPSSIRDGLSVHRELEWNRPLSLRRTGTAIDALGAKRRLLVQWVPHAFGLKSMNLPICLWILKRALVSKDVVEIMIHEPFMRFAGTVRQRFLAIMHRAMMACLLAAASRVWVSVPRWWDLVKPLAFGRSVPVSWLPIPSNVPTEASVESVTRLRNRLGDAPCVGHFGQSGPVSDALVLPILEAVLDRCPTVSIRLIGRGTSNTRTQLVNRRSDDGSRITAEDDVPLDEIADLIASCDVLVQPYLDGVSSRRTSFMAGLGLGVACVTHVGASSEPIWSEAGACSLVESTPEAYADAVARLLDDESERVRLGERAREVYFSRFHLCHVVERLRSPSDPTLPPVEATLGSGRG